MPLGSISLLGDRLHLALAALVDHRIDLAGDEQRADEHRALVAVAHAARIEDVARRDLGLEAGRHLDLGWAACRPAWGSGRAAPAPACWWPRPWADPGPRARRRGRPAGRRRRREPRTRPGRMPRDLVQCDASSCAVSYCVEGTPSEREPRIRLRRAAGGAPFYGDRFVKGVGHGGCAGLSLMHMSARPGMAEVPGRRVLQRSG